MKIVHTKYFPFGDYAIINLFGVLFSKIKKIPDVYINHESIHTAQMKEMGYIFFYLWYGIEYLIVQCFHRTQDGGYHDISFEEEAYAYENNLDYLEHRKHYAWFKYLKAGSYAEKSKKKSR